jgi:oligogalacturonide transporter
MIYIGGILMEKDSLKKKLMYGCGDIYGGGAFLLISLLFLNYLTDVELMAPALAGATIMIGKLWDAVTYPVMGYISDNTKSKFGRRRVYFLFGVIPVFITFSLLWYSFGMVSGPSKFLYYLIMYMLFNTSFTLVMIPYNSILPDITTDYKERTSYTGIRMLFSISSAILAGIMPMIIINSNSNIKIGYLTMAVFFAALYALPWLIVFFGTKEKVRDEKSKSNVNLYKQLISVFNNKSFKIHAGIFISAQTAVDFLTTLFIYYLTNCIGRQKEFPMVLGTYFLWYR